MNALIDLEHCRESMTISLNGVDHTVRLAGTIEEPFFCGKDICGILDHKDFKYALKTHVPLKYKKKLFHFYGENDLDLGGGIPPPQIMVKTNHNILGKNEITFREGQVAFVSEPGLYALIMNSSTKFATMFQELVLETILPSIRRYGSYQAEMRLTETMAQLAIRDQSYERAEKRAEEERQRAEELEEKLEQERLLKERTERETKEKIARCLKFNQATRMVEPREYIYIATTDAYSRDNKFKPGGCSAFNLVKSRLSQYNSGKSDSDMHYFVYLKKVVSYRAVEQALQGCLGGFRENLNKELFIINFDWLVKCVDAIIEHNTEFMVFVNLNRDQMVEDTMNKEPVAVVPIRLEKVRISFQLYGEDEVELSSEDQQIIDAVKESLATFFPDNDVVKRVVFENHLKQNFPKVEIGKRKRQVWGMAKKIGLQINPCWKYRY